MTDSGQARGDRFQGVSLAGQRSTDNLHPNEISQWIPGPGQDMQGLAPISEMSDTSSL